MTRVGAGAGAPAWTAQPFGRFVVVGTERLLERQDDIADQVALVIVGDNPMVGLEG